MNKTYFLIIVLSILFCSTASAQPQKGKFVKASIGLGLCAPYDETDITGSGFFAQGEYVLGVTSWFGVRPYAAVIIASNDSDKPELSGYSIKSNAFLIGTKVRIAAPIPYFAPYIETGVGLSLGSFETHTLETDKEKNGALPHIPFTIGVALGRKHNVEVEFTYFYHDAVKQFSGAAAVGLTFPLDGN